MYENNAIDMCIDASLETRAIMRVKFYIVI